MHTNKLTASHYGIQFDSDKIAWLIQGRGAGVNVSGVGGACPFVVNSEGGRHCNTQISLAVPLPHPTHWELFMDLVNDELVRAMLPIPKQNMGVFYMEHDEKLIEFLGMLSRMSAPIYPIVVPFFTYDRQSFLKAMSESNVQPLVMYGASPTDVGFIRETAQPASVRPRKVIFTGPKEIVLPPVVKKISTTIMDKYKFSELNVLPWEVLGATTLRKWMRREWNGSETVLSKPTNIR